ncbi:hypothetical protein GQ53DRAFT_33340 [Thozetella sp. PMI_491]|nr:hypothetical protein GQ53DRAFT_33340 [Thozetella sp. PMI_491]
MTTPSWPARWLRSALWSAAVVPILAQGSGQTLIPWSFTPLPLGSVQPGGWLLAEMQKSAAGLAGHEADFYPFVADSRWLHTPGSNAGNDYSSLNEALPYWLNGLVPLAYGLNDTRLKQQVQTVVDTILGFQASDGWLGPEVGDARNLWARSPLLLALTQLAEADPAYEGRIVASMRSFLNITHSMLSDGGKGFTDCGTGIDCSWGQVRYHDLIISIQWLLEHHPDPKSDALLWDNMNMLFNQTLFRWDSWYAEGTYQKVITDPTTGNPLFAFLHGVNVGQGLKSLAVIYRFTHNSSLLQTTNNAVEWTFQYHGAPSGTVLADEIMRDLASYSGSELCTAVETAYSLEYLYLSLGVNQYADRAERAIFNALPVMLTTDHWGHQYMDQPNGPWTNNSAVASSYPQVFTTSAWGVATTFGMEPMYPCCTVNHPQGFPKFLSNSWAVVDDKTLIHALLSPSTVTASLKVGNVTIECATDYPFVNTFTYSVSADANFSLRLRVPGWATFVEVHTIIGSKEESFQQDSAGGLVQVGLPSGKSTVTYKLGADVRTEARENGAVSVYVGSVLYALDPSPVANISSLPHHFYDAGGPPIPDVPFSQARDYYFYGEGEWAIAIDPSTLKYHAPASSPVVPFVPGLDAGHISVDGCALNWTLRFGATPDVPPKNVTCTGKKATYTLVPYGQAKVHMSELPVINLAKAAQAAEIGVSDEAEALTSSASLPLATRVVHPEEQANMAGYLKVQ